MIYIEFMSEYRVTYAEIPNPRSDDKTHDGALIYIQPPVQLNPDAVERYLTFGDFVPIDRSGDWTSMDFKDVCLLGSTATQTTIYVSIEKGYEDGVLAEQAANHTVELLRFMGAQATIGDLPSADA